MKTLLLVNSNPGGIGIGELFLADMLRGAKDESIFRFSITQERKPRPDKWLKFPSHTRYAWAPSLPFFSDIALFYFMLTQAREISTQISNLVTNNKIECIWIVMNSPLTIILADMIYENTGVRKIAHVWDDPDYFMSNARYTSITKKIIKKVFSKVIKRSHGVCVIDEGMSRLYKQRYQVDSVVMRHGIDQKYVGNKALLKIKSNKQLFNIVFSGSLYAKKEWNAFVSAIAKYNLMNKGVSVYLHHIGRFPRFGATTNEYVIKHGYVSFQKNIELMSGMNAAYLPYWFSENKRTVCMTSFPSKLSSYTVAGLVVFYHAPKYASAKSFFEKYKYAVHCESLSVNEILSKLDAVIQLSDKSQELSVEINSAYENEFSLNKMHLVFHRLTNLSTTSLTVNGN